jgi:predicted nucleotidyltransferase
MLREQKNWLKAKKRVKLWMRKNRVADVILFGSFVRDKLKPGDVDLCIITRDAMEAAGLELVDSLKQELKESGLNFQVNILTEGELLFSGNTLARTLLEEGVSIWRGKPLAEIIGFKPKSLFIYSLKNFSPSQRVRLHYVLNGRRGEQGVLAEIGGRLLGAGVIEAPVQFEDKLTEIFGLWKVQFRVQRVLG